MFDDEHDNDNDNDNDDDDDDEDEEDDEDEDECDKHLKRRRTREDPMMIANHSLVRRRAKAFPVEQSRDVCRWRRFATCHRDRFVSLKRIDVELPPVTSIVQRVVVSIIIFRSYSQVIHFSGCFRRVNNVDWRTSSHPLCVETLLVVLDRSLVARNDNDNEHGDDDDAAAAMFLFV
jgi:hypothetical protein